MLTCEALDRRYDLLHDLIADFGRHLRPEHPRPDATTDRVLNRLARHRIGCDDVHAAFAAPELRRARLILDAAGRARGRTIGESGAQPRRARERPRPLRHVNLGPQWTDQLRAITCTAEA